MGGGKNTIENSKQVVAMPTKALGLKVVSNGHAWALTRLKIRQGGDEKNTVRGAKCWFFKGEGALVGGVDSPGGGEGGVTQGFFFSLTHTVLF